jgi:CarboxypepD_reg-like domain/TonB-dependent Receptor Plug Domain
MNRLVIFMSLCFLFEADFVWGQNKITLAVTDAAFADFVKSIEEKTDYQFYYNPKWTDSLAVTVSVADAELKDALFEVLRPTELNFAIGLDNKVFITKNKTLLTTLPKGFLPKRGFEGAEENFDAASFDRKVKKTAGDETKIYVLGAKSASLVGNAAVSGYVRDVANGEPLPGVSVFLPDPLIGTSTDVLGRFSLTMPKGKRTITIQSVGMKTTQRTLMLYGDGKLDVEMEEEITSLKEVVINSDQEISVTGVQMGKEKLDIKSMKQMPLALGETDVMKIVLTLPGVQTVGEGTNGLNVRGGASNQNLILFNGATVYNPSHLFGFFSTFNPDVIKSIELYKSGFEANLGGRLSSVLDVTSREGNLKKFTATGGISPITGRLTLEGPIIKGRTSFLLSGRSTYSDWILKKLENKEFKNSTASFYDLNLNIGHKIDDNNQLTISAYNSRDQFKLNTDTLYSYSDRNASIRWSHRFNQKLFGELTVTGSEYQFSMSSNGNPINAFSLDYAVRQYQAKADFNYILNDRNTLNVGISSIHYGLKPGSYLPLGEKSLVSRDVLEREQGLESAFYVGDNVELNPKLSLYFGFRYSHFSYLGPRQVFQYTSGLPIEESSILDTVQFSSGTITTYQGAEPRVNARYMIDKNTSLKFSYGRTTQYIQMLSNNTAIAPTDIWKLSDQYIKPQIGDQFSVGWFKNWGVFEFSAEGYYKLIHQATDYQDGAVLIRNHHLETDVLNAKGKSYGAEFMAQKSLGRLNGWVSYTYSRSFLKAESEFDVETVNKGKYYPSNFDKPHAVNVITNYKFNRRINISLNMTYSTGRPITLPLAKFELDGVSRLVYSDRNAYRVPDYFRTDLSINVEGNHKIKKLAHSSWTFAVYNLTGRRNAYSVFFRSENGKINGYKLSVFGQAIPTITYNFRM